MTHEKPERKPIIGLRSKPGCKDAAQLKALVADMAAQEELDRAKAVLEAQLDRSASQGKCLAMHPTSSLASAFFFIVLHGLIVNSLIQSLTCSLTYSPAAPFLP